MTNLMVFYDWLGRSEMDIVYLYFSKALDTLTHDTLTGKLRKHGLDEL